MYKKYFFTLILAKLFSQKLLQMVGDFHKLNVLRAVTVPVSPSLEIEQIVEILTQSQ